MDIEDPTQLEAYLRHTGRLDDNLTLASTVLPGGVSNRTVHVRLGDGDRVEIEHLAEGARNLHVLMNNCYEDYAVRGARDLAGLLSSADVPVLDANT